MSGSCDENRGNYVIMSRYSACGRDPQLVKGLSASPSPSERNVTMNILHNRKKYQLALVTSAIVLLAGCSSLAAPGQPETSTPETPSVQPEPSPPAGTKPAEPNQSEAEPVKEKPAEQEKPAETKPPKQEPARAGKNPQA